MEKTKPDWLSSLNIFAATVAFMGVLFMLFMHLDNKMDGKFLQISSKIDMLQSDINKEIRDFHGRLCTIESAKNKGVE